MSRLRAQDLDAGLRRLNSRLFVVRGKPLEVLPQLITEWGVSTIVRCALARALPR